MSPTGDGTAHPAPGFPRVSGDEPTRLGLTGDTLQFSPRERG